MSLSDGAIRAAIQACREWPEGVACAFNWYWGGEEEREYHGGCIPVTSEYG